MAASVFVPIATTGAVVQLIAGLLVGRVHLRVLLAVALILEAAILVAATRLTSVPLAYAFGVGWGIQGGIEILVMRVIFANYFGRLHLGAIAGFATLLIAASALGSMPMGIARDCLLFGKPPAMSPHVEKTDD